MSSPALDIAAMSPAERIALIERLWEALDEGHLPVTPENRAVLDDRLADLEADRASGRPLGVPWEEVRERWAGERYR